MPDPGTTVDLTAAPPSGTFASHDHLTVSTADGVPVEHVAIDGVRLALRRLGKTKRGRIPLVLLHSSGRSGAVWLPLLTELATHREVLAVDRRGSGDSERRDPLDLDRLVDDLIALLLHDSDRHPGPVDIVAEGDAADAVGQLCVVRPDLVRRLVLVDGPRGLDPEGRTTLQYWRRASAGQLRQLRQARQTPARLDARAQRILLIVAAPAGLTAARTLMNALVAAAEDPASVRLASVPGIKRSVLTEAPARVQQLIDEFLLEPSA
jgi:pimeloyl-ACP methyl ester carboxylesterase